MVKNKHKAMNKITTSKKNENTLTLKNYVKRIIGIGDFRSVGFCRELGFKANSKTSYFTNKQKATLVNYIEDYSKISINDTIVKHTNDNIQKLIDNRSYRGLRHRNGLPVRGQRTHTNRKTARKLNKTRKNF